MQLIPVKELFPHPNNTAPFSAEYKCKVYPERVQQLMKLIELNGFDANYPIVARVMVGYGKPYYEVIEGNHRLIAVKELYKKTGLPKWSAVPTEIKEMDDYEVAIAQVTRQGRPIDTLIHARHLFNLLGEFGDDRSEYCAKTSNYAALCGLSVRTVRGLYRIGEVLNHLESTMNPKHYELLSDRISPYVFEEIAQLPKYQWEWFALYFLRNRVSFGDARAMILRSKYATADIEYCPELAHRLNKVLTEVAQYNDSNLDVLKAWCERQMLEQSSDNGLNSNVSDVQPHKSLSENDNFGYFVSKITVYDINSLKHNEVCVIHNRNLWHYRGETCLVMIINPMLSSGEYQAVKLYGDRPNAIVKEYLVTQKRLSNPATANLVTIIYHKPIKITKYDPACMTGVSGKEIGGLLLAVLRSLNATAYYLLED